MSSGNKDDLSRFTLRPATEKTLSEGADDAGIRRVSRIFYKISAGYPNFLADIGLSQNYVKTRKSSLKYG
jgi:hypothetical protein